MPDLVGEKRAKRNTHPLLQHRLAASAAGWPIIPCNAKDKPPYGWPRLRCDAAAIRGEEGDKETHAIWRGLKYMGTAVRITGQLCVIDSDVSTPAVAALIMDALEDLDPAAFAQAVVRDSGAATFAVFYRFETPPRHFHYDTRRYTAYPERLADLEAARAMPENDDAESDAKVAAESAAWKALDPQKVEFYAPGANRYFSYEGPHSPGRVYRCWDDRGPWNVPIADLPVLPVDPPVFIDHCDKLLAQHLTVIPEPQSSGATVLYDLKPSTKFYPKDGIADTLENYAGSLQPGVEHGIRGCLPWTRASKSNANCKLFLSSSGRLVVSEWSNGCNHYMESEAPAPPVELDAETIAAIEALQPPKADAASEPKPEQPRSHRRDDIDTTGTPEEVHDRAVNWLVRNIANFTQAFRGRGGVVSIHPDGEYQTPISLTALREAMADYAWVEHGPRGGLHVHNPVSRWSTQTGQKIHIHGIRMRPELPRPVFFENGLRMLNRYQPPMHPATGGTVKPFLERQTIMFPVDEERAWVNNWIMWKVQNPHRRGVALAMVARDNGAGRGLLAETLQRVLGKQFVVSMPYANISGGSKFNAEVEGRLLLYVNEAAPAEGHKYRGRNAAREALKDFIEPNHEIPFRVEPKGVDAYYTQAATSTMVFTNNIDGLPIDEADRRIAVVTNGPQMSVEERDAYRAWLDDPANVGALYRHLRDGKVEMDRSVFDPYMSPHFHGRALMIEAGKSAIDRAWDKAAEKLETAADLYCMSQIVTLARNMARKHNHSDFDDLIESHTISKGYRVGIKNSTNWLTRWGTAEDNRERVYAFSESAARTWTHCHPHEIKAQLDKAQRVVEEPLRAFNKALHLVKDADVTE